jgi:hypothetical protein
MADRFICASVFGAAVYLGAQVRSSIARREEAGIPGQGERARAATAAAA